MLPSTRGVLVLLLAVPLIALGALIRGVEWLGWVYALFALAMFYADWRMAGGVQRFDVERKHENKLSLGVQNPVTLNVRNRLRRGTSFQVRDEAPEEFQIETRVMEGSVPPLGTWRQIYHLQPLRRGDYRFGNITLRWRGPLGLVYRQGVVQAETPVKVYPNLMDVRKYDLMLRKNRLQEMGLRHTRMFGEGTEFERLREYLPDDEYRRINWKATARRHRPVTVQYQTERSQTVIAVLDTGRMMQSPVANIAKLDYAVNAVLFLGYVATGKGDRVGVMSFADDVSHYLAPRQGRGQFYRMLEVLYAVDAQPVEPNYRKALTYLAVKQRRRALVVIFTDLSSGASLDSLVAQVSLLARSSLPLVVTISDPDVHAAADQVPTDMLSVYQRASAAHMLDERRLVLDTLRKRGVLTLDVPANQLSLAVINRYLELKGRTML
ncbi:MAG: DUF58 domain-containing protein [Chloroflexi bacterium]|nr:DUF58 domain-containing protein [Chloroflexota bacterium]MDL1942808.1 DUF58 domain-containing protein [Chloroflexi bacterium CFX2]